MNPGAVERMKSIDVGVAGDIAAVAAERLRQRALDDVDAVRHAVALAHAAAVGAVHADRVHLIEIGHRAIPRREVADRADRGDVGVHRIDRLEGDQLRRGGRRGAQQRLQMRHVVMPEDRADARASP